MKLTELNSTPGKVAKQALKEQFNFNLNLDNLGLYDTRHLLRKTRSLINEVKASPTNFSSEKNPAYLKLVFLEQALLSHYTDMKSLPINNPSIVVENEEVQKSQVLLAVQEMVNTMQKMVEQVSDMLVKELPAVKSGVENEYGTTKSDQFSSVASEALTALQASVSQAKVGIEGALGGLTSPTGFGELDGQEADIAAPTDTELPDDGTPAPTGLDSEEPAEEPNIGRAVR